MIIYPHPTSEPSACAPDWVPSGDVYLGGSRYDVLAGNHDVLPRFGSSWCGEFSLGFQWEEMHTVCCFGTQRDKVVVIKCVVNQVYIRSESGWCVWE